MKDIEKRYFNAEIPEIVDTNFENELRGRLIKEYKLNPTESTELIRTRNKMRFAYALCTFMFIALGMVFLNPQFAVKAHNYTFSDVYTECAQTEEPDSLVKVVEAEYFELEEDDVPAKYIVEKYVSKELGAVTYIKDPNKIENLYKSL